LFVCFLAFSSLVLGFGPYVAPNLASDYRPACPALTTLANHGELPHTGWFSLDGMISAMKANFNICPSLVHLFFDFGYTVPGAQNAKFPFPSSYIFTLGQLQTPEGGEHDASLSLLDNEEGVNTTLYNAAKGALLITFSTDGQFMTLNDLHSAHLAAMNRSDILNNRTAANRPPDLAFRTLGDMCLLWLAFGSQPINNTQLLTFLGGQFPTNSWPKATTEFCVDDMVSCMWPYLGQTVPLNDFIGFQLCTQLIGLGGGNPPLSDQICYDNFPQANIPVTPLNWVGLNYPQPTLGDPFTSIWPLALKFPSNQADVNCALNATQLVAARRGTLLQYYFALTAANYVQLQALATPVFVNSSSTSIHQAAAGDYYGLEEIIEYVSLVVPSLNGGYVWFSPSVLDVSSVKYFPQNATIFAKQTHKTTFDCYQFPNGKNPTGICHSPTVNGIAGGMFTFESCGTKVVQYISNFDDYTNEAAVRESNSWDTCWRAMAYCTGVNQIFGGSFEACAGYMAQIPTVSCKQSVLRGNNTVCRGLHSFLAKFRPDLHCPHVSAGSTVCIDDHCDEVICPNQLSRLDYRWSPIPPKSCNAATGLPKFAFFHLLLLLSSLILIMY
jgi:hypothetical protein